MTYGGIYGKIIRFAVPLMINGLLQTFYNAADMIVVGRFMGKTALSAIGATAPVISMLISLFMGLSAAAGIITARKLGAHDENGVSVIVHTSIALGALCGAFISVLGISTARNVMQALQTPPAVTDYAVVYIRIYYAGAVFSVVYNFCKSILSAAGDARRPLYYLIISGAVNVLLNIIFIAIFKWGVAGAAISTVISQAISAVLAIRCLLKTNECYRLYLSKLKIHLSSIPEILSIGIPSAIQGIGFSLSNVIIQSAINSVGDTAIAANTACASAEGFGIIATGAVYQAALTFISQNYGAQNYDRIKKGAIAAAVTTAVTGLVTGGTAAVFSKQILSFYVTDVSVIKTAQSRLLKTAPMTPFCGIMDIGVAGQRAMGRSTLPMIIALTGICGLRAMITAFFAPYKCFSDLNVLYYSFGASWILTGIVQNLAFVFLFRKRKKQYLTHQG